MAGMDRRVFLGLISTAAVGLGGCVGEQEDENKPFEAEVYVSQGGFEEYSGRVRLFDGESGDVLLSEGFVQSISMTEGNDTDGVQTGSVTMGGYFFVDLQENKTYDVAVDLDTGVHEEYEWTPGELHGLQVSTSPDSVSFEEGEKTYDEDSLG